MVLIPERLQHMSHVFDEIPIENILRKDEKLIFSQFAKRPEIRYYPVEDSLQDIVETHVQEWLERGYIRRVRSSRIGAPIKLIYNHDDDEPMICIDYRAINSVTDPIDYDMPIADHEIHKVAGRRFYSLLVLKDPYFHIPVKPICRHLTAFESPSGVYEFNVMSVGLKNAPKILQRRLDTLLAYYRQHYFLVYQGRVLIYSNTYREHISHVEQVMNQLWQDDFQIDPGKTIFAEQSIDFLGKTIDFDGIRVSRKHLEKIIKFSRPEDFYDVRSFMGLAAYCSIYIFNYPAKIQPFSDMMRATNFRWTQSAQNSFNQIKDEIETDEYRTPFRAARNHEIYIRTPSNATAEVTLYQFEPRNNCNMEVFSTGIRVPKFQNYEYKVVYGLSEACKKWRYFLDLSKRKCTVFLDIDVYEIYDDQLNEEIYEMMEDLSDNCYYAIEKDETSDNYDSEESWDSDY